MRQSKLFTKTLREAPKDEIAVNAQLLERGGFVFKNSAGIYSFLPLGWRVIQKISSIIKEEMNAVGGQEIFMPALIEKKYLEPTNRWDVEVGFKAFGKDDDEARFTLGWTHEEVLTTIAAKYIDSYKDLPFYAYQIQTKFRNEARAKSGLLRGREFMMKDLYSFHKSTEDLYKYYDEVKQAYFNVFRRCGLEPVYTVAAGGDFTADNTHEFQVIAEVGEDVILFCEQCGYAENTEIASKNTACSKCAASMKEQNAIEVGNIFPLGIKYSQALNLQFIDADGEKKYVVMGSYGIGLSRLMGTIVEVSHDEHGIIWPASLAPFDIHLVALLGGEKEAESLYNSLQSLGYEILYDDRDKTPGEKLVDSDLLGIPVRVLVSQRSLKKLSAEVRFRKDGKTEMVKLSDIERYCKDIVSTEV